MKVFLSERAGGAVLVQARLEGAALGDLTVLVGGKGGAADFHGWTAEELSRLLSQGAEHDLEPKQR